VDQSQLVVDHRIGLDANEVLLQIVQSMCYQDDIENGRGRNWGMQFPLAISADMRMFTVLRSLYCMKPAMKQKGLIMESSTLSMAMTDGKMSPHWSLDKLEKLVKLKGPKTYVATEELALDERFKGNSVYLYWLNFDPSSRYLLFVSQDLQQKSAAATFEIKHEPTLTTTALNHAGLKGAAALAAKPEWSRDFNMVKFAYHKDFPLLGFSFAGMLYLWPFKNGMLSMLRPIVHMLIADLQLQRTLHQCATLIQSRMLRSLSVESTCSSASLWKAVQSAGPSLLASFKSRTSVSHTTNHHPG
jgi:hypothetical protein